ATDYLRDGLREIVRRGADYGRSTAGEGRAVVVEFVSANPTGPLHIGHGRQAALGDAISELLTWTGWKVHREFYYNDAGEQIARLTRSLQARYRQALGDHLEFPDDGYHGDYVKDLARDFAAREGDRFRTDESSEALEALRIFAVDALRAEQNRDLEVL